jgi:hypothetical protein
MTARTVRRVGALLGLLAGLWFVAGGVEAAHACDPVTLEGCDMSSNPSPTTAAPQGPTPQQPPVTQAPAPRGEPFIPQGQQQAPAQPVDPAVPSTAISSPAPAEPTPAVDSSSTDDSGGGGVPGKLGLLVPALVLAGVGVGVLARQKGKADPVPEYTQICNELCWLRDQDAEAQREIATAGTQIQLIDEAHARARAYLRDQLRADYLRHRGRRAAATTLLAASTPLSALACGIGFPLSNAMHGERSRWRGYFSPRQWNDEVNAELVTAQAEIDRMRAEAVDRWTTKRLDALLRATDIAVASGSARSKLAAVQGANPDVTFPPCACL